MLSCGRAVVHKLRVSGYISSSTQPVQLSTTINKEYYIQNMTLKDGNASEWMLLVTEIYMQKLYQPFITETDIFFK